VLAVAFYLLWFVGYQHYLAADGRLDAALTHNLATASAAGLRWLGYAATVTGSRNEPLVSLWGQPAVLIGNPCNGLVLYALFSGFILAFPGAGRRKWWFIPLGIGLIYGLNILRIIGLCLNSYYAHDSLEFNHHYTFVIVVYAGIFVLWMWWVTRLAPRFTVAAPAYEPA
ncbi:MAG: hypothetical protein EOO62_14035, partial [Hymenobacter sp.]